MIHRRCVWIYHARLIIRKGKTGMKKGCPAGVWSGGKSRAGFISSRFLPAPCQSFCRRHVTQKMCLWIFFLPPSRFPVHSVPSLFRTKTALNGVWKVVCGKIHFLFFSFFFLLWIYPPFCFVFSQVAVPTWDAFSSRVGMVKQGWFLKSCRSSG